MKTCNGCKIFKDFTDFYKDTSKKDGFRTVCKSCEIAKTRTVDGYISEMFKRLKRNSRERNHIAPQFTKGQFKNWLLFSTDFLYLHKEWENANYHKDFAPSVDRLDDYKSYFFENMRLVPWSINNEKGAYDRRYGINTKQSKSVLQYSKNNQYLKTFFSISFASRETGVTRQSITRCCSGKLKTAGGFKWKYKKGI